MGTVTSGKFVCLRSDLAAISGHDGNSLVCEMTGSGWGRAQSLHSIQNGMGKTSTQSRTFVISGLNVF